MIPRFALPLAAILATESNGQSVRIDRKAGTMVQLQQALRLAMRYRGYRIAVHKDSDESVCVWVKGRTDS